MTNQGTSGYGFNNGCRKNQIFNFDWCLFSSKLWSRAPEANCNQKYLPLIINLCGFLGPITFWSSNSTVLNYVEVVLKITDNGAAMKKGYCIPNNPSFAG